MAHNNVKVTAERMFPSGGWFVSAMVEGYMVGRRYLGYSKREAIAEFRGDLAEQYKCRYPTNESCDCALCMESFDPLPVR